MGINFNLQWWGGASPYINLLLITILNVVAQLQLKYHTPEKYLELEEKSGTKNEYLDGEIINP